MELVGVMNNIYLIILSLVIAIFISVIIVLVVITKHQIEAIRNLSETTMILHNRMEKLNLYILENLNKIDEYDRQEQSGRK